MYDEERLVTIKQASLLIDGLSQYRIRKMHPKSTSYGACISGQLPCFKSGKKYLIRENTIFRVVLGEDDEKI